MFCFYLPGIIIIFILVLLMAILCTYGATRLDDDLSKEEVCEKVHDGDNFLATTDDLMEEANGYMCADSCPCELTDDEKK